MLDSNPFRKVQITISLNKSSVMTNKIERLSIEIGYPDSKGEYIWKSSGRVYDKNTKSFLRSIGRNGNEIYSILPGTWDIENSQNDFIFDFVRNMKPCKILIRQFLFSEVNNLSEEVEFEIPETEAFLSFPYIDVKVSEKVIGTE